MSQDIRNFFKRPNGSKQEAAVKNVKEQEPKKKKRVILSSDEEDDDFKVKPTPKKPKESLKAGKSSQPTATPVKPVDLNDFFGTSPVERKPQTLIKPKKDNEKRKKIDKNGKLWKESHSDEEFEATLCELDESILIDDEEIKLETPKKSKEIEQITNSDQKKKANAQAYQRYLNRSGPKNLGSKEIPTGTPTCLANKSFVITGVLDSLEREEATILIQSCGGHVKSAVSRKTDYIVLGEEPGKSKVSRAEKMKTKKIDEDGLLELIRELSKENDKKAKEVKTPILDKDSKYFSGSKRPAEEQLTSQPKEKSIRLSLSPEKPKIKEFEEVKGKEEKSMKSPAKREKGNVKSPAKIEKRNLKSPKDKHKKNSPNSSQIDDDSGFGSSETQSEPSVKQLNGENMLLWVDKYKPTNTKQMIGQGGEKSNVKKLTHWLLNWHRHHGDQKKKPPPKPAPWAAGKDDGAAFKAALLSGPPGVGKTTSVHLLSKELGFDIVEFNASDTRSKRLLSEQVADLLSSKSINNFYYQEKSQMSHVLVMDEVDGMAGNEDRGGIQELIKLIKNSRIPIICMCNDRSHPKIRSLVNYCFDLRFQRPRVEQIKGAMMSICCREGLKISGDALVELIAASNQDIRQVLHNLYVLASKNGGLTTEQAKIDAEKAKKSLKLGPWDVVRQVFSASERKKMTFREKEDLFFQDYSLGPLFVQDTYIQVKPHAAENNKIKTLECLEKAADSLAWGDVVERNIRSNNAWSLLPVQAIYSSVLPGHIMSGHLTGQIQFPAWLGKNSKRSRIDRLLQELQVHMRLKTSGGKKAINLDYSQILRDKIVRPLIKDGIDGINESIEILKGYDLVREDLDSILEISQWPNKPDLFSKVDSKVKAAFTRTYNKNNFATPYSIVSIKKGKGTSGDDFEDGDGLMDGDEANGSRQEENDDADDIANDAMIKKGKGKKPKTSPVKTTSKGESSRRGRKK